MGGKELKRAKKHICAGIVAHVDAGKTTLSEGILYLSGNIRKLGRVDHKDAFLDTYALERERGITIFSKQAVVRRGELEMTLLDTPGHVDFSAETERVLGVLDYAVLVISGADGVQGHTETLWRLLEEYRIPVFLFINKMDQPGTDREERLSELKKRLSEGCVCFGGESGAAPGEEAMEELSMTDEDALEEYLDSGAVSDDKLRRLIRERKVFPCYFGSALKLEGVEELLEGLERYTQMPEYPEAFAARVFKITRDEQGNRLTHMKITGGSLRVKSMINGEKADQLRLYSGAKYELEEEAAAGTVCAVAGLTGTRPGQGLGTEPDAAEPVLEPVLNYRICLPPDCDVHTVFRKLKQLEEEDPQLHIVWEDTLNEIHARVMGEVQIEILKSVIHDRFGVEVTFDSGNIVYKETIRQRAEGVGHFEPLRHYAEVHLLLEPLEPGSGLVFASNCSEDSLDLNWQRLILTHLAEKKHRGVLTGSEITDMKITLAAGRAHLKHTEGGDFRQATYRAVRQGLKRADSMLLEPVYEFRLEVPSEMTGRALSDIQRMSGSFENPVPEGDMTVIEGSAPVVTMRGYPVELAAYSRGRGRLFCSLRGYEPCHNPEEVIKARGYDSEQDEENPTGSVFCGHGAGYYVPWDQVEKHMHLESVLSARAAVEKGTVPFSQSREPGQGGRGTVPFPQSREPGGGERGAVPLPRSRDFGREEKELEEIFTRTYGAPRRRTGGGHTVLEQKPQEAERFSQKPGGEEYLLVDGYNIIFSWDELKELAKDNLEGARNKLMDILSNYQGFRRQTVILVFDAYRVEGGQGSVAKYHNIYVVYTKEAETADQYIEKTVHKIGKKHRVTVATSDGLEQVIILGQGAGRMSAKGLWEEIEAARRELRESHLNRAGRTGNYLFDYLPKDSAEAVEDARLGKKQLFDENQ